MLMIPQCLGDVDNVRIRSYNCLALAVALTQSQISSAALFECRIFAVLVVTYLK
jgi:hypothetical protein